MTSRVWATPLAGVCGLFAAAFFTLVVVWLWAIGYGIWLARSSKAEVVRESVATPAVV